MKCNILVFIITTCVLSGSLASKNNNNNSSKIERVHSEVMSYVYDEMGNHKMMRGNSKHLDCFNGFIPLINYLASNARDVSNYCVNDANKEKDQELPKLNIERQQIETEVDKIKKSLADCSEGEGLQYFVCLADNADLNKQLMEIIRTKSKELITKYAEKSAEIDENEENCIMNAIEMAKLASDKAFVDLKSCLNGGPAIQPFIDEV